MNRIIVKAYGKLNLGLEILGRDERGYHDLRMVMQSVGVFDLLTITEEGQGLRLTCDDPGGRFHGPVSFSSSATFPASRPLPGSRARAARAAARASGSRPVW